MVGQWQCRLRYNNMNKGELRELKTFTYEEYSKWWRDTDKEAAERQAEIRMEWACGRQNK